MATKKKTKTAAKPTTRKPARKKATVEVLDDEFVEDDAQCEPVDGELERDVWEKLPSESDKEYAWFHAYMMLGGKRSVLAAYNSVLQENHEKTRKITIFKPKPNASELCRSAAVKHNWKNRAAVWDEHVRHEREEEVRQWQDEMQVKMREVAEMMINRAKEMLAHPLRETTVDKDGRTYIIKPAKWTMGMTAQLVSAAQELVKLTYGMDVKKIIDEINGLDDDFLIAQAEGVIEARRKREYSALR